MNGEHERNINNITYDDLYQSPKKKKDVSTINESVHNESDEHVYTTSDSSKQVDARNNPIKETHIVDGVSNLSIKVGSFYPAVIGIIRQDSTDLVMHVLTNSIKQLSMTSSSPLNTFQSKLFMIGLQYESVGGNRNIIYTSHDSINSMGDNIMIGNPGVNKDIFIPRSDTTSNFLSCTGSIKKFDTQVHGSMTQERNLESSCIEEVGVKSILPEIVKESGSSGRMNPANSVLRDSPKFISLRHPTAETADIRNIDLATSTRANNCNWLRRDTERDDRLGYMHDFENMSKTTAYPNHIKNSELETRQVFERKIWSPENIQRTLPIDMVT